MLCVQRPEAPGFLCNMVPPCSDYLLGPGPWDAESVLHSLRWGSQVALGLQQGTVMGGLVLCSQQRLAPAEMWLTWESGGGLPFQN